MKKVIFLFMVLLTVGVSCRQENDYILNPNDAVQASYDTYTDQFEVVWNAINTGYAFWDVTDVDWDQRYQEFKPRFEELDRKHKASKERADSATFINLYKDLTRGLVDHHMEIRLRDSLRTYSYYPGLEEVMSRSYFYLLDANATKSFFGDLMKDPNFKVLCQGFFKEGYLATAIYQLPDGRIIPYLYSRSFAGLKQARIAAEKNDTAKQYVATMETYTNLVVNTPREKIAGAIMDVRNNTGGNMYDLDEYCGLFIGEDTAIAESRYKEGMGRYDLSPASPVFITCPKMHRDMAAENIPVVVLCNIYTISCAEFTTNAIKSLPTGHAIGERTYGAHGPLQTPEGFSINYSGVLGDPDLKNMNHYIFTSNFQMLYGGKCLEGIGITPDEEVLYKDAGFYGQFKAGVNYISNYK